MWHPVKRRRKAPIHKDPPVDCITTPETDRPAPTTIAIKTRGNRIFQMISAVVLWRSSAYWAGSLRKIRQTRMRATSGMAISTGPNVMELRTDNSNRTSSTTTHRVNGKRRRPAFRLVFAIDGFTLVIFIPLFPRFGVCLERFGRPTLCVWAARTSLCIYSPMGWQMQF